MRAKTSAQRAAAAIFCLLSGAAAAVPALFLPAIYAELAGRN